MSKSRRKPAKEPLGYGCSGCQSRMHGEGLCAQCLNKLAKHRSKKAIGTATKYR